MKEATAYTSPALAVCKGRLSLETGLLELGELLLLCLDFGLCGDALVSDTLHRLDTYYDCVSLRRESIVFVHSSLRFSRILAERHPLCFTPIEVNHGSHPRCRQGRQDSSASGIIYKYSSCAQESQSAIFQQQQGSRANARRAIHNCQQQALASDRSFDTGR